MVATTLGAFGYDVKNGEEILLTDDSMLFAWHCVELVKAPEVGAQMAERAYQRFLNCWTWDSYERIVRSAVESAKSNGLRK